MNDFYTAQEIDASLKEKLEEYIDYYAQKYLQDLLEKTTFESGYICPLCKRCFRHLSMVTNHLHWRSTNWEMQLLRKIYASSPRNLPLFDAFYGSGFDSVGNELRNRIRFWVLCVRLYESINPMPMWKDTEELNTNGFVKRIFWENEAKLKS